MLETITNLYMNISEASKGNPLLASAVGLWGLGVATYLVRVFIPKIVFFISRQFTTTIILNNAGNNQYIFRTFMTWFIFSKWSRVSRCLSVNGWWKNGAIETSKGPGYGYHLFVFQKRLFWFYKVQLKSDGDAIKEEICITMLGRNTQIIDNLINEFSPKEVVDTIRVYTLSASGDWQPFGASLALRPIESVVINETTKKHLVKQLDDFYTKREWYLKRGLPHKFTVCLHGIPGCGKTSLIKSLASHYRKDVFTLNMNTVSDAKFQTVISNIPAGSFLIMEDFDSCNATIDRSKVVSVKSNPDDCIAPSLSTILNTLDGVVPLDNLVIFMTTNYIENIDAAILRKGRTDMVVELGLLTDKEIKQYVKYVYKLDNLPNIHCSDISGADLQSIFLEHKDDFDGFMKSLQESHGVIPNRVISKKPKVSVDMNLHDRL